MFQYIQERVQAKITGWQTRFLSHAGKETLIKAVAYAMPVYSMNCFQLPKELCSEINSMVARFWWGSTEEQRKISWVAWKKMTRTKNEGGLGFRDLYHFNQALLANQVWKLLNRPESLLFKILKARYFRDGDILSANRGSQPSYGWNSLRFGCELIRKGMQVNIGDGRDTKIGLDPWLPTIPPRAPMLLPEVDPTQPVNCIIDEPSHHWNVERMLQIVDPVDHPVIHKIFLPSHPKRDAIIWSHTINGGYTVKSGYWLASTSSLTAEDPRPALFHHPYLAKNIWKQSISPKLKHFLWRLASKAIGVAKNLINRNIRVNPYCSRCCIDIETSDHAFFICPHSTAIWKATCIPCDTLLSTSIPLEDKIRQLLTLGEDKKVEKHIRLLPFWILWHIWKGRNEMVFNRKRLNFSDILNKARLDTKEWLDETELSSSESRHGIQAIISQRSRWTKPSGEWIKCNYDASHHEGNQNSGLGWILRNASGTVMHCGMGKFQGRNTVAEAECSALVWALQSSWGLGYRKVEFECDNLTINRLLNGRNDNRRLQNYIETINLWKTMFEDIKFSYKPRQQNSCADHLAKSSILCVYDWVLYDCCPSFLMTHVMSVSNNAF